MGLWSTSSGNVYRTSGNVGIGDSTPDGTLRLDVEGRVGATEYCDQNGANCKSPSSILTSIPSNYVRNVEVVNTVHNPPARYGGAYCTAGRKPIGGGCSGNTIAYDQTLISSAPLINQGWWCVYNRPPDNGFGVFVICADY